MSEDGELVCGMPCTLVCTETSGKGNFVLALVWLQLAVVELSSFTSGEDPVGRTW